LIKAPHSKRKSLNKKEKPSIPKRKEKVKIEEPKPVSRKILIELNNVT
jgi:hypothetical protein